MKNLKDYITESLKKLDTNNVRVIDRNFKEGLSVDDFRKFVKKDFDECFNLSSNQLNKDYDKFINKKIDERINKNEDYIVKQAAIRYKSQKHIDRYIEEEKEKIKAATYKEYPKNTLTSIRTCFNPLSDSFVTVTADSENNLYNRRKWNSITLESLVHNFENFGFYDSDGKWVNLHDGIIGWTITYYTYDNTTCPAHEIADLKLKLNKDTEKVVTHRLRQLHNAISDYYDSKLPGEYTGD